MQLSETIKLHMTKKQKDFITRTMNEYIKTVNSLVSVALNVEPISRYTTADVDANLPSALTNQCIRDAKSIIRKYEKKCHRVSAIHEKEPSVPVLRRPCCYINNQNFGIRDDRIEFPVIIDGRSKRISVHTSLTDRQKQILTDAKLGTMRIVCKGSKIVAQIVYEVSEPG